MIKNFETCVKSFTISINYLYYIFLVSPGAPLLFLLIRKFLSTKKPNWISYADADAALSEEYVLLLINRSKTDPIPQTKLVCRFKTNSDFGSLIFLSFVRWCDPCWKTLWSLQYLQMTCAFYCNFYTAALRKCLIISG